MSPTPTPIPVPPVPLDEWATPADRIRDALEEVSRSPLQGGERADLDQLLAEAYGTGLTPWFWLAVVAVVVAAIWVIGKLTLETRKLVRTEDAANRRAAERAAYEADRARAKQEARAADAKRRIGGVTEEAER